MSYGFAVYLRATNNFDFVDTRWFLLIESDCMRRRSSNLAITYLEDKVQCSPILKLCFPDIVIEKNIWIAVLVIEAGFHTVHAKQNILNVLIPRQYYDGSFSSLFTSSCHSSWSILVSIDLLTMDIHPESCTASQKYDVRVRVQLWFLLDLSFWCFYGLTNVFQAVLACIFATDPDKSTSCSTILAMPHACRPWNAVCNLASTDQPAYWFLIFEADHHEIILALQYSWSEYGSERKERTHKRSKDGSAKPPDSDGNTLSKNGSKKTKIKTIGSL